MVKIEYLNDSRLQDFISFCKRYRGDIDDSYLYDDDLKDFAPNSENPTYIVTNAQNELIAAVSVITTEFWKRTGKARIRIFYSKVQDIELYRMMLNAIIKHMEGFQKFYQYVHLKDKQMMDFMDRLDFTIERYTFLLIRDAMDIPEITLPEGYYIKPLVKGRDEEAWCQVRNAAFSKVKGSEMPVTPEVLAQAFTARDYLEGGLMLLYHGDRPVGAVRAADEEFEGSPVLGVSTIAIIPEYQGKGLGRCLLRAALHFAIKKSYNRILLSVNADNDRAKTLYIQEGFKQVEADACYQYDLTK